MRVDYHGSAFRMDQFLSERIFHPLVKLGCFGSVGLSVPILMYHSVSDRQENLGHPYFETNTRPETFRRHMLLLKENGFVTVDLGDLLSTQNGTSSVGKPVAITFDDGYADFYHGAFRVLQEFGMTATVFLPTQYIGEQARKYNGRECLSWRQVIEARRYGILFGSHTRTHANLTISSAQEMDEEIGGSKKELESRLGEGIASFSFPFAFPEADKEFLRQYHDCLERHGYRVAVCTRIRRLDRSSPRYSLPRLPVNDHDDVVFLRTKLEGGYDWLGHLQYGKKLAKKWLVGEGIGYKR